MQTSRERAPGALVAQRMLRQRRVVVDHHAVLAERQRRVLDALVWRRERRRARTGFVRHSDDPTRWVNEGVGVLVRPARRGDAWRVLDATGEPVGEAASRQEALSLIVQHHLDRCTSG